MLVVWHKKQRSQDRKDETKVRGKAKNKRSIQQARNRASNSGRC